MRLQMIWGIIWRGYYQVWSILKLTNLVLIKTWK